MKTEFRMWIHLLMVIGLLVNINKEILQEEIKRLERIWPENVPLCEFCWQTQCLSVADCPVRFLGLYIRGVEEKSRSRKEGLLQEDECIVRINNTDLMDKTFSQ